MDLEQMARHVDLERRRLHELQRSLDVREQRLDELEKTLAAATQASQEDSQEDSRADAEIKNLLNAITALEEAQALEFKASGEAHQATLEALNKVQLFPGGGALRHQERGMRVQ